MASGWLRQIVRPIVNANLWGTYPFRIAGHSPPLLDSEARSSKGEISMRDKQKAEEIATKRVQLLAPLLDGNLDRAKARELRAWLCQESGLSDRTLRRYLERYRQEGFFGLQPRDRRPESNAIPPAVLEQAVLLRREVPSRSVSQLIQIMEWEGLIEKDQIRRSTLQEKLTEKGYSTRQMRVYAETGVATRRWQKPHRNRLWQSALKYEPYLPIGPNGTAKRVYLVTFLDDAALGRGG